MTVLQIRSIGKSFGGFVAVNNVSLTVGEGEVVAIIGPNGAGKSTFFSCLSGHLKPTSGEVVFNGTDITGMEPHRIWRLGLGRSFQHANIFAHLTVFENIQAGLIVHRRNGRNLWSRSASFHADDVFALLASIGLAEHAHDVSGTLSYGNQKQLELGLALASDPRMLLLDEPTAGMSASETHGAIAMIQRIAAERRLTLLFTEHDMDVVFSIAQRIAVLHQGQLIAFGTPAEVRADATVRTVYLGHDKE
jgi:branched-chain amino acid transport system ATP-binding protein